MEKLSKRVAFVLRHAPESAGLTLSAIGAVEVGALAAALGVTVAEVEAVVAVPGKPRFVIEAGMIRARHGHTIRVMPVGVGGAVPTTLFHGTTAEAWRAIRLGGLLPMKRQFVHLSPSQAMAREVAARRRGDVLLAVAAAAAAAHGVPFVQATEGVWLSGPIAAEFIRLA